MLVCLVFWGLQSNLLSSALLIVTGLVRNAAFDGFVKVPDFDMKSCLVCIPHVFPDVIHVYRIRVYDIQLKSL